MDKEARLIKLEEWLEEGDNEGQGSSRARMDGAWESRVSPIETKIKCLESMVGEIQQEMGQAGKGAMKKESKAHLGV